MATSRENKNVTSEDWSGKCILVVDDVELNYNIIRMMLRKKNAKMIWALNGQEAVDLCLSNSKIDMVLMDIRMPVMDGYEATRQIKAFNKDLPVIAQTAYALTEDREKCMAAGCDDFIAKPISVNNLIETIEKYLKKKRK